jgi:hypothetical protein
MVEAIRWTPEAWSAAVEALQSQSSVSELLSLHEGGAVSSLEVVGAILKHCHDKPAVAAGIASALHQHPSEDARWIGRELQRVLDEYARQIKDIEQIRRTSPLQPGTRLILSGGYSAAYSRPWWLNGREYYKATFIMFAERGAGKMPVAVVELDTEIDMTEGRGLRHNGRFALLRLLYVSNWTETETVTVHVVEALPDCVETFYGPHPFGTEIETHAKYSIESGNTR